MTALPFRAPPGAFAWTDPLRRSIESVRGVSLRARTADADAGWSALRARLAETRARWQRFAKSRAPNADTARDALLLAKSKRPPVPGDPSVSGALLAMGDCAPRWDGRSAAPDVVDWLVGAGGLVHAVEATIASADRWVGRFGEPILVPREWLAYAQYGRPLTMPFEVTRHHVAMADDADYLAARAAAALVFDAPTRDVAREGIAYMFPGERFADELLAADPSSMPLLTATRDPSAVARCVAAAAAARLDPAKGSLESRVAAVFACAGTSDEVVSAMLALHDKLSYVDEKRAAARAIARVQTRAALIGLASRALVKTVQPALAKAIAASPGIAAEVLEELGRGSSELADAARRLLRGVQGA